jgi:curved DNA-binding protein CbpA
MYQNLLNIQNSTVRMEMIQTILSSPEHRASAKAAGVYGNLLHYSQVIQAGGAPPMLPGQRSASSGSSVPMQPMQPMQQQLAIRQDSVQARSASEKGNERAMNYFSACLRIMELEEEVALTEESLKSAYKKAVVRAHPDKGGSEKEFEAVTRAYAYLGEILRRIHGGRAKEGKVEAPAALKGSRTNDADAWKMVEPVRLNPTKLDMNSFNTMFEQTRIPDPEESGYGDWLKGEDNASANSKGPKFSGKFNREVFHKAFEDEQKAKSSGPSSANAIVAQEQTLAGRYATEIGRTARDDYTVAANDDGLKYTDLKKAYTEYNTFSQQTAGVKIENRTLDRYSKERDTAPAPLADYEMAALQASERAATQAEEQRKLRLAQESVAENDYFERMKRLVIRNS